MIDPNDIDRAALKPICVALHTDGFNLKMSFFQSRNGNTCTWVGTDEEFEIGPRVYDQIPNPDNRTMRRMVMAIEGLERLRAGGKLTKAQQREWKAFGIRPEDFTDLSPL